MVVTDCVSASVAAAGSDVEGVLGGQVLRKCRTDFVQTLRAVSTENEAGAVG